MCSMEDKDIELIEEKINKGYIFFNCGDTTEKAIMKLLQAYKQNEKSLELADRILKIVISDMQLEGYFKGMKYESVIEYYKRREDL